MVKYLKIVCIVVGILFLVSIAMPVIASANHIKTGDGFKGVFEKDKPDKPPGKPDKPPKPPEDEEPEPDPSVDKWAVVIGISDYRGRRYDLQYCDDDARDMYEYLREKGYPEGNIKLLLDGNAKAETIMAAIDWLNSWENNLDSEVVFFYSGHGDYCYGYDDGDTEDRDEAIVSADLHLILDGQLRAKFASFTSEKIAFIFDTCYSGGMDDLIGAHTSTTYNGRVVATACGEGQYSWDGPDWMQNGVFTYYFMDGLNTCNTIEGAHTYAEPLAHDYVELHYNAQMNPQMYDNYPTETSPGDDWAF